MPFVILTKQLHCKSWIWSNLYGRTFSPFLNYPLSQIPKSSKTSERSFPSSSEQVPSSSRVPPTILSPSLVLFSDLPLKTLHHATRVGLFPPTVVPSSPVVPTLSCRIPALGKQRDLSSPCSQSCVSCHPLLPGSSRGTSIPSSSERFLICKPFF